MDARFKGFLDNVKKTDPARFHVWLEFCEVLSDVSPVVPAAAGGQPGGTKGTGRVYSQLEVETMIQQFNKKIADLEGQLRDLQPKA